MPHDNARTKSHRAEHARAGDSRSERNESAQPETLGSEISAAADAINARLGELRAKSFKVGMRAQTEMFDTLQAIRRDWAARAASEAEFAFNLPNRLTSAGSVPDAISVCERWLGEWLSMRSEDRRRLVSDGQKIVATGLRCLASLSPAPLMS